MSPEMFRNFELYRRYRVCEAYNAAVDIWAIGVLIYALAVGKLPYDRPVSNNNQVVSSFSSN